MAPEVMMMRDAAEPEFDSGRVLLGVSGVAICGSEISGYLGHNELWRPPLIMGQASFSSSF
jgi:threonine dehydrogenase-like Zn-dependent dehydrogenase